MGYLFDGVEFLCLWFQTVHGDQNWVEEFEIRCIDPCTHLHDA